MKKLFTFLMMLFMSIGMYAGTTTFTASLNLVNGTDNNFTFNAQKNNGQTNPTYNEGGKDVRIYAKGSYEITYNAGKITSVVFNISTQGKKRLALITANDGTVATQTSEDETVEWSGNSSSVKFTVGDKANYGSDGSDKAGQLCFTSVVITYTSESAVAEPAISGTTPFVNTTEVTITCSDAEATVYYTTDDTAPTNTSTQYIRPFTLNATTTVKAIAYKGTSHSEVVTQEFVCFPHVSTIDALTTLTDNTEFIFDGEAVCIYQHGDYTYIQDETTATLLYGTINDDITYNITSVIPAGWQGKKITDDGHSEITNLSGFTAATASCKIEAKELDLSKINNIDDFGKYVVAKNVMISTSTPEPPTPAAHELTYDIINVDGTEYTDWTKQGGTSKAIYTGQTAGGYKAIQMRSKNSNSGIVTTTSAGLVKSISITWNENTTIGRTVWIYGKNTPYSATTDLYDTNKRGDKLGEITIGENTNMITVDGDYAYWGIRSKDNALYLDAIDVDWSSSSSSAPIRAKATGNYILTDGVNTLTASPTKLGYDEIPDNLTKRYDAYGVLDFHNGVAQLLPLGFVDSEGTVTSVNDIDDTQVIDMKYYDITGRESSKPYNGLNIVVLKYQNGNTRTVKVIK